MRYPQGGGLTAERRAVRKAVRLEAASRFAAGQDNAMIARELRVHVRSVQRWRAAWEVAGEQALRSKGPPSLPTLSDESFAALEAEPEKEPAAHGWSDQRWTLPRIKTLIGRRFHQPYTEQGVRKLLVRHAWSWQMPARRAVERDEQAVAAWVKGTWPAAEEPRRRSALGAWLLFEDEAGFSMTPPTARTWGRRGRTPIVRVRGRSRRRLSIAALACYKPGERARLIYRPRRDDGADGRKSFAWSDYRDLQIAAHLQLGGPLVVVWDNLNTHRAAGMRRFIAEHDWLTVYHLPPYAPQLNPVEGIWSLLRRGPLANRIFATPEDLIRVVRRGLREIQYRPHVIDGVLAETGLTIGAPP